jgi:RecB family endonuclease NucS
VIGDIPITAVTKSVVRGYKQTLLSYPANRYKGKRKEKTLLVIELKKGRASDAVVGQIQRYMGYVKEELAEPGQDVKGVIIALDEDLRLKRALSVTNNIEFYSYKVSFSLRKAD